MTPTEEETLQQLEGSILTNSNTYLRLLYQLAISTLLYYLTLCTSVLFWCGYGMCYGSLLMSFLWVCLFFDGLLVKNKLHNIACWLSVLSEMHANLKQAYNKNETV